MVIARTGCSPGPSRSPESIIGSDAGSATWTARRMASVPSGAAVAGATAVRGFVFGAGVFYKDETGDIFHTYSCYARGGDILLGTYNYLDLTPKGRNETGPSFNLTDWVRHHDRYDDDGFVDPTGRHRPKGADSSCDAYEDRPEGGRTQ